MTIKVFPANRPLFEGVHDKTGAKLKWVTFGSAVWLEVIGSPNRQSAIQDASKLVRQTKGLTSSMLRVVKADNRWRIVQRGFSSFIPGSRNPASLTTTSIQKLVR